MKITLSIIIVTLNRAPYLEKTLQSIFRHIKGNMEIIVVNGPSHDNTELVVKKFPVKYYKTNFKNISIARNIGIKYAKGDIVYFIDDDAIPSVSCYQKIIKTFNDNTLKNVAAIAGKVIDSKNNRIQFNHGYVSIWGEIFMIGKSNDNFNSPKGYYFKTTMGANSAYSRSALIQIGGFDEEIEYHLDESDVCVRLIRAGYRLISSDNIVVYHDYAPSPIRDFNRKIFNYNKIVKNRIYFAIKNSRSYAPLILRLIKPFTLEYDKFILIIKSKDINFVNKIFKLTDLTFWLVRGYIKGFLFKRKLVAF